MVYGTPPWMALVTNSQDHVRDMETYMLQQNNSLVRRLVGLRRTALLASVGSIGITALVSGPGPYTAAIDFHGSRLRRQPRFDQGEWSIVG